MSNSEFSSIYGITPNMLNRWKREALVLSEEYGYTINGKAVQRHMREMGIEAIHPSQKTSTPNPRHTVYPYLLKGMNMQRPNQVWASKKRRCILSNINLDYS